TDPVALARNAIMTAVGPSCYTRAPNLNLLLVTSQAWSLYRDGLGPHRDIYNAYSVLCASGLGDVRGAREFSDRLPESVTGSARVRCAYSATAFLGHWRRPLPEVLDRMMKVHQDCIEAGDLLYASFSLMSCGTSVLFMGDDLRHQRSLFD